MVAILSKSDHLLKEWFFIPFRIFEIILIKTNTNNETNKTKTNTDENKNILDL